MIDSLHRTIDYMRISLTDRCNLRCRYCMPENVPALSRGEILTYEELLEICRTAVDLGITNFKITGGEPLVRKDWSSFVRRLKYMDGVRTVTLTTNGILLAEAVPELQDLGIDSVNISLDTTDPEEYERLTGCPQLDQVLRGMDACVSAGIQTRLNCVLLPKTRPQLLPLAAFAKDAPVDVRFIELMPIGYGKGVSGISRDEAREVLLQAYPDLHRIHGEDPHTGNGPAVYEYSEHLKGRIGWISALSHQFCAQCNRVRLTAAGFLKPCLCYEDGVDLKHILREENVSPAARKTALRGRITEAIAAKPVQHCFSELSKISETHSMSQIGG